MFVNVIDFVLFFFQIKTLLQCLKWLPVVSGSKFWAGLRCSHHWRIWDWILSETRSGIQTHLNPPNYFWKYWPAFLFLSSPSFPAFRLWNMPRRFQDQRPSLRGNQSKRWRRLCPKLQLEPGSPKSHPWNLCGAGTRRRRKLWLLSKPFTSYRYLGILRDHGKIAWIVLFSAVTIIFSFPSLLKFKLV